MRFGSLFDIDREEAVNNLDRGFEAKLNAFHSLYDVSKSLFPYADFGDTALLIAVRNALHHHDAPYSTACSRGCISRTGSGDGREAPSCSRDTTHATAARSP